MLLRPDVHLRPVVRLPELVRLPGDEERVKPEDSLARELVADRETFLAFLRARVRSPADAEDIFQQAILKATAHAAELQDPDRKRAWFFRIVRNTLADHHARGAARESKHAALAATVDLTSPAEVALCACILGQLDGLRAEYKDILRRVDVEEHSLGEVASALGITTNLATVRLHRARKALREKLQSFCGTESMRACLDCSC